MENIRSQIDAGMNAFELSFTADDIKYKYQKQRNKKITAITTSICCFAFAFIILLSPITPQQDSIFEMIMSKNFLSKGNGKQSVKTYASYTTESTEATTIKARKNKKPKKNKKPNQEPTEKPTQSKAPAVKPAKKHKPKKKATEPTKKATQPTTKLTKQQLFVGQYEYNLLSDGTAEISNFRGVSQVIKVPSEIDGYKVTKIGNGAFSSAKNAYKVVISEGITEIGEWAFSGAYGIESVTLPNSLVKIGKRAFSTCPIKSITIPDNVKDIGDNAFTTCLNLTEVKIGKGIESIGSNAFDKSYVNTISGYIDTVAFNYAKQNGINFINLGYAY